jgi:hypothetical protein
MPHGDARGVADALSAAADDSSPQLLVVGGDVLVIVETADEIAPAGLPPAEAPAAG